MRKKAALVAWIIVLFIAVTVIIWDFFGLRYANKETADKYRALITSASESDYPTFFLPEEYHFYGRYVLTNGFPALEVADDRMVYKRFFEYNGETYYFYHSDAINYYKITYPDIYNMSNEKVAKLRDNPEGYFILDRYLYYAYGKDYYNVRVFTGGFLTGHDTFVHRNYKDFQYARLNLDTMINEEITRADFEAKYYAADDSVER